MADVRTGLHETDEVQQSLARASRELLAADERLQQRVREAVDESGRAQRSALSLQKLEALRRLTGGIAHDFNNLLQTMTTGIRLASMSSTDARVQKALASCERAVLKAPRLTRQLMTFGSSQPGAPGAGRAEPGAQRTRCDRRPGRGERQLAPPHARSRRGGGCAGR